MTLPNALFAFREEVERGSIDGLKWKLPRSNDGTLATLNIAEFVRMEISFRPADVLGIWPEWPAVSAWNAAKTRPWQPPSGIPKGWIRSLPASPYLPFADVVDFLAFGPAKTAIGLSFVEEQAATLRAGIALVNAAIDSKVTFVGMPCERLATPHLLRQTGPRTMIEPERLRDLIPVPFGGRSWLGPRRYADEYAEIGYAPQSVSFCDVVVEWALLLKWMNAISAEAPGLSEADVTQLISSEKAKDPSVSIGTIQQLIKSKDPLFSRDSIREIARKNGVEGRRGRRRKSAE